MNQVRTKPMDSPVQIPPELMRSTPRACRLTVGGRFALGVAIFMVLGATAFSLGAYVSVKKNTALKREMAERGQVVSATVVKTYRTGDDNKRDVFLYEFDLDGKTHNGRTDIGIGHSPHYRVGTAIPVRYLPDRPNKNWIEGYPPGAIPLFLIPVLGGMMLVVAYAMLWRLRRQQELVAEGRAALARVLSVKRVRRGEHKKQRAQIEFALMSGARQEAYLEFGKNAPPPNSALVVLYDRENPLRILRYPACLVRVEKPGEF